ncbi:MAG: FAD-dependent thymidylate synthase [Patescibacteria group bacterium]|nr:FAD-dependent thymidylate synthase [Patescibacteria group bacterium]
MRPKTPKPKLATNGSFDLWSSIMGIGALSSTSRLRSCSLWTGGISHELVRHRLASYTQSSTRFINYVKKMPPMFVKPAEITIALDGIWENAVKASEAAYKSLIEAGVAPQIARSVFPNALATKVVMTCNLRNWRHFLLMRTTKETHPQMRQVTIPLLAQFKKAVPLLFDDIEPGQRQADNLKKAR